MAERQMIQRPDTQETAPDSAALLQEIVYAISHDLGAPLRAVTGFSAILQKRYGERLDEEGIKYLDFIVDGGAKAQRMLAGLLSFSRVHTEQEPFASVDLTDLSAVGIAANAERIGFLKARVQTDKLPVVRGSPRLLRQLVAALVDNALIYHAPNVPPVIAATAAEDNAAWRISVSDQGIGMRETDIPKAFVLFRRLNPEDTYGPGIGMGLPVARRIAQKHGGDLHIALNRDTGITATATIAKSAPLRAS